MSVEIREAIRAEALAMGFDAVGFAEARLAEQARADLGEFLARGYHGDMGWLADTAARRGDPQTLWPEARTIVVLGLNYAGDDDPLIAARRPGARRDLGLCPRPRLSRHGKRAAEGAGAVDRRALALANSRCLSTPPRSWKSRWPQKAGLGWQGKHTNLVSRAFGSWMFLGEIYLSLALAPDAPESDHCGHCQRCLDICPTNAFPAPYRLDARRCISYLTIEHKGPIPHDLRPLIGNRIFGCDDCLAVCPWNKFAQATEEPAFLPREELTAPLLAELAGLDDAAFRARFPGTAVKRIGRNRFLRNVLIAIGNVPTPTGELMAAAPRLPR